MSEIIDKSIIRIFWPTKLAKIKHNNNTTQGWEGYGKIGGFPLQVKSVFGRTFLKSKLVTGIMNLASIYIIK